MSELVDKISSIAVAYRSILLAIGITITSILGGGLGAVEYLDGRYIKVSDSKVLYKGILTNRVLQLESAVDNLRRDKLKLENKDNLTLRDKLSLEELKDKLKSQTVIRDETRKELRNLK